MPYPGGYAQIPYAGWLLPPPDVGELPPPIPATGARFTYSAQLGAYPWAYGLWAGGYPPPTYPGGGIIPTPRPERGVVQVAVWWPDAPALHLARIYPDGTREPVRGGYPVATTDATRRNYATNPSLEAGSNGYVPSTGNPTLTVIADPAAPAGGSVLRATNAAAGSSAVTVPTAALPLVTTTQAGTVAWAMRTSAKAATGALTVAWLNSGGTTISTSTVNLTTDQLTMSTNAFLRIVCAVSIPVTAVTATMKITLTGMPAGGTFDLDAVTVETAATTGEPFDGSDLGGSWLGTPHLSVSVLAPVSTVLDGECPLDVPVRYELTDPAITGGQVTADPVTLTGAGSWLTHPDHPDDPMPIDLRAVPVLERAIEQGVFWPIGATRAVVVSAPRRAATTELSINTYSFTERDTLRALLADGSPILLRAPGEYGCGPGSWYAVGNLSEDREARKAWQDYTLVRAPVVEVSPPSAVTGI